MSADRNPDNQCDVAIAGAGLAGGLIALALAERRPDLDVLLIDAGERAGGNHLWSFFDSDVDRQGRELLGPLVAYRWEAGHEVRFPSWTRQLNIPYNSIPSGKFDAHLRAILGENLLLGRVVTGLSATEILLADGKRIRARAVIDARGFISKLATNRGTSGADEDWAGCDPTAYPPTGRYSVACPASSGAGHFSFPQHIPGLECGWQKFAGQMLRLAAPHGLSRPIIMDATVDQIDGYRFVYVLPAGPERLFVEDTYYSDGPELDVPAIRQRIAAYAAGHGWKVEAVEHEETGVLPVTKGGSFDRFWPEDEGVARAGVRAGLFHPTTGYSLPAATRFALWVADNIVLDGASLARTARARAAVHWRSGGYYRLLGVMLFDAAPPAERYRIFERFYRLPQPLIARFYRGGSTLADKIRLLCGRPPVRIRAAMQAVFKRKRA